MAHAEDDTEAVVFELAFDPMRGPVSERVVEAIARFYKVESADIDPLYSVIDPDALDALFAPSQARRRSKGMVTFQYDSVTVSVNGNGTIRLSEPE